MGGGGDCCLSKEIDSEESLFSSKIRREQRKTSERDVRT